MKNGSARAVSAASEPSHSSAPAVPKKVPMKGSRSGGVSKPTSGGKKDVKRSEKKKSAEKKVFINFEFYLT